MMGLTDRLEPWTRRFQRAPARPAAAPPERASAAPPAPAGRFARSGRDAAAEPPAPHAGRFTRRALHEQER